jgi:hypothetical protein
VALGAASPYGGPLSSDPADFSPMPHRRPHLDALAIGLMVVLCAAWGLNQVAV